MPVIVTISPKTTKNFCHSPFCVMLSKPPNITSIDMSGSVASTDSTRALFEVSVVSVM